MRLKLPWLGKHRIEIIERSKFLLRVYYQPAWKFNLLYLHPRYMETPEKRRKSRNAANTQHPQRYCPPSFLVNRMSLSDDRIELGVPARLNLLVLTVLTDIWKGNGRKKKKKEKKRLNYTLTFKKQQTLLNLIFTFDNFHNLLSHTLG